MKRFIAFLSPSGDAINFTTSAGITLQSADDGASRNEILL
jgi:hypothetical protein